MLSTGNTGLLSPALVSLLVSTGTDPIQCLQQLRGLF
jgi:hypothetical protein